MTPEGEKTLELEEVPPVPPPHDGNIRNINK